jgi:3-hydroxyacyl-CoA dehydrogenase
MRLVEVVRGKATEKPVIATAMGLAKTLKKVGVLVRNGFGFVGNRMMFPYMYEAQFLAEEGSTPQPIDRLRREQARRSGIDGRARLGDSPHCVICAGPEDVITPVPLFNLLAHCNSTFS